MYYAKILVLFHLNKRLSLRTRLALGYSAFFAAVLTLLGGGVFFVVHLLLFNEIEAELRTSATVIQQDFIVRDPNISSYFQDSDFLSRTHETQLEGLEVRALYVQVTAPSGVVMASSASLQRQQLPLDATVRIAAKSGQSRFVVVSIGTGQAYMLASPLRVGTTIVGILQVAQPLREIDLVLNWLGIGLTITSVIALLTAIRGGAWLAHRALQPVDWMAAATNRILRAEDLGQRVPTVSSKDEIGRLTSTINQMLERLEQQFVAQQRFIADASHELRTPLTAMRGNLEILRRGAASDPQILQESLRDIEREVSRLALLTNDLLVLAQADTGTKVRLEPVALDDLVLETVRNLSPLTEGVALQPLIAEQVMILGDRDRLKQALINLVTNALQHTPVGGLVQIELARDQEYAYLRVHDTGAGIASVDLPHVFDRFYRADTSRVRHTGGSGLGLSIVQWVAEAHNGHVTVESKIGAGSVFTLVLPITPVNSSLPLY